MDIYSGLEFGFQYYFLFFYIKKKIPLHMHSPGAHAP